MGLLVCSTKAGRLGCPLVWGVYIPQALAELHGNDNWSAPCWEGVVLSATCRVHAGSWERNAQGRNYRMLLEPCQYLQQHHCT